MTGLAQHLYHYSAGEGPAVLLINAAYQGADSWKALVHALRRNYTVIAFDLPNQGRSPSDVGLCTIPAYSEVVLDFLAYKGIDTQSLVGFGFSLGADILIDLVVNRSVRFRAALAAGATPTGIDGYVNQHIETQLRMLRDHGVAAMARVMLQKVFSPRHYHVYPGAVDFAIQSLMKTYGESPERLEALLLATRPNRLQCEGDHSCAEYMRLVQGSEDILYPLSLYTDFGPGLSISPVVVPGGHSFAIEQPRETAALIHRAFAAAS